MYRVKISTTTRSTAENPPRMLDWDSEWWGLRVGGAERIEGLGEWAIANTVGLMCVLIDADRPEEAQQAEAHGFRFMDVRVTLERHTISCGSGSRLVRAEDTAKLRKIARSAYRGITRFYADPSLPNERCDDLYDEWIRRSCAGYTDIVLVAERDSNPVGYVTVNAKDGHAKIVLIAVADDYRGMGVGQELVSSAVNWAHSKEAKTISVVTQGRNLNAQRVFQRGGFRTANTSLWFHKTYAGGV
jgi:dTDP-4-amino-4,6-dideoxy-D-galactose acyltransferase